MSVVHSLYIAHESSPEEALSWFQKSIFTDIPPYFLTHWKTNKRFFYAGDALLAYEETNKHLVVAGEPLVAAGSSDQEIYQAFHEFAKRRNKKICGYYVGKSWSWNLFSKVPMGTSIRISLADFDLKAPEAKEVRRALRKGQKHTYTATPIALKKRSQHTQVKELFKRWKKTKAPFEIKFFLSQPRAESLVETYEEWFVVEKDGASLAFCSLLPYLRDGELGFYVDNLIYDPEKEPFALSYLISFLIEVFKDEGVSELNLGLNPFAQVDRGGVIGGIFSLLYRFPFFYRPKGLHFFKSKFTGTEEEEFCFFEKRRSHWLGLADMARVTMLGSKPTL